MQMPKVDECDATDCAYNQERRCHALAINIAAGPHARCDTYWAAASKGGDPNTTGCVGACQAAGCRYNESLECTAQGIQVGHANGEVDCLTFSVREVAGVM